MATMKRLADVPKNFKGMDPAEARKFDAELPPVQAPGNEELCRGKLVILKPAPKRAKA